MNPCTPLVPKVPVHIVPRPSDDDHDRECCSVKKAIFSFDLLNQLPDLVVDGAEALTPFQSWVNGPDLANGILLAL